MTPSGGTPSSIWALPETFAVNAEIGGASAAFYQCSLGTDFPKPTRIWGTIRGIQDMPHHTWPTFGRAGKYLGPLPASCGHRHSTKLVGRLPDGSFRTANTAAYPPAMCSMLADLILEDFRAKQQLLSRPSSAAQGERGVSGLAGSGKGEVGAGLASASSGQGPGRLKATLIPATLVEGEGADSSSENDDCGFPKPKLCDHLGGFGSPLEASWGGAGPGVP